MVGPFPKKPISADEWRSKARAFQAQLEGLSIDELMRGPIGETQPAGSAGSRDPHARNQPRAPKGHPDGGQWVRTGHTSDSRLAATNETQPGARGTIPAGRSRTSDTRTTLQNADLTLPRIFPPGVVPKGAPPEIVLNALNPDATVYSDSGAPDVAGAITGTVTTLANGFEVTNGTFGFIARNLANGQIDAAIVSVPQGVTARVIKLPNGDIQLTFSTGI
ncbi:MAG TPA: hypothetical protein VFB68_16940 [Xanthobacteraceae bacterium]|nr:hypothetical protein [Xanthobacteraceae bacterium]